MMSELAKVGVVLGSALVALFLPALVVPKPAGRWANAFSRHRVAGYVIVLVDIVWAGWLLCHASFLAEIEWARTVIYVAAPVSYVLIVMFMDELLAARAAGALLLLAPGVVLKNAMWHPSSAHYVMTVLAYIFILAGVTIVLSPFRLRQVISALAKKDVIFRATGLFGVLLGGVVLYLSFTAY